MKRYKYKFTNLMLILIGIGIFIALLTFGLNVYRIFKMLLGGITPSIYNYLSIGITMLLSLAFIVICLSMPISSYYKIAENKIVLKLGIIKSSYSVSDFKEMKLYKNKGLLHLIFKDDTMLSINVKNDELENFVDELNKTCPKISYIQISDDIKGE